MIILFTLPARAVTCLLVSTILISTLHTANAQRLRLSFSSGASFSNYLGANDSGPKGFPTSFAANPYYYNSSNPVLSNPSAGTYQKPYYQTSATRDVRTGFYASVLMEFKITKRFSVEHGLSYVQKGIDINFSTPIETSTSQGYYSFVRSIHTNYISTPLAARYYLDRKGRFYVLAGWYDAFAIKSKVKEASISATAFTKGDLPTSVSSSTSRQTAIKTNVFDCGFIAGAGFALPINDQLSIGLDARINMGLMRLQGDTSRDSYLDLKYSTTNINLETGLRVVYTLPVAF